MLAPVLLRQVGVLDWVRVYLLGQGEQQARLLRVPLKADLSTLGYGHKKPSGNRRHLK
jgi:hypothetical protein